MFAELFDVPETFRLDAMATWSWPQISAYFLTIMAGIEILQWLIMHVFGPTRELIPIRGKHLDALSTKDWAFITFNRCTTPLMVFHMIQVVYAYGGEGSHVKWAPEDATVLNTLGSLALFFVLYDFIYVLFHRLLHVRGVYQWVHKHHHRQNAPSRGNVDAVNVHPFEFVTGEYLHVLAVWAIPCHVYAAVAFVAVGGLMASLNHTRWDIAVLTYDVKAHDLHHRLPQSNYGQYIMLWDKLMGSFRPYVPPTKAA